MNFTTINRNKNILNDFNVAKKSALDERHRIGGKHATKVSRNWKDLTPRKKRIVAIN